MARGAGAGSSKSRRKIALFGGTFDPIHAGHIAVAQAAMRQLRLDAIYFVPSGRPPHKPKRAPHAFAHRHAMVALACAGRRGWIASLAESPESAGAVNGVFYSVDTVRRFRREFPKDKIYFIVGADSFLQLPTWHRWEALLESCDFVVANRPEFGMQKLRSVIPAPMLKERDSRNARAIALRHSTVHLLGSVNSRVSSTEIRKRIASGQTVKGLVPAAVEDYIQKQEIYR